MKLKSLALCCVLIAVSYTAFSDSVSVLCSTPPGGIYCKDPLTDQPVKDFWSCQIHFDLCHLMDLTDVQTKAVISETAMTGSIQNILLTQYSGSATSYDSYKIISKLRKDEAPASEGGQGINNPSAALTQLLFGPNSNQNNDPGVLSYLIKGSPIGQQNLFGELLQSVKSSDTQVSEGNFFTLLEKVKLFSGSQPKPDDFSSQSEDAALSFNSLADANAYSEDQAKNARHFIGYVAALRSLAVDPANADILTSLSSDKYQELKEKIKNLKPGEKLNINPQLLYYIYNIRAYNAQVSVGLTTLYRMYLERLANIELKPDQAIALKLLPPGSTQSKMVSRLQLDELLASRRLRDPDWYKNIDAATTLAIQKENVYINAEVLNQLFQLRMAIERMNATMATLELEGAKAIDSARQYQMSMSQNSPPQKPVYKWIRDPGS